MTPSSLKDWRKRLGLTQARAAEAIGVSVAMYRWYETGVRDGRAVEIPKPVAYACAAIAHGLPPIP